ncbi:hypothetical protein U9M48_036794 [Paspalum notatum var. saurae]|uniref:Agenet domain-containing protein n=1 Tax=Paspalum notatum var. saurae TaxID=547442 RepID=A0AAQ3UEP4_PASNO
MRRGRPPKNRRPRPRVSAEEAGDPIPEPVLLLPVGAEVEVRSDDPGFAGAFFEATVVAALDAGGYLVRYDTLETEACDGTPLVEPAAAAHVRPRPPPPGRREFALHEAVDALHNEGWWSGVVSAVPPPPVGAGRYEVTFPTSREVMPFEAAELRPRLVFKAGKWVPFADAGNGSPLFRKGERVEVSGSVKKFGEFWNPATVLKVIDATYFLVQYRHAGKHMELVTEIMNAEYIRPARPFILMDSKYRLSPSSYVEIFHEGSWQPGVIMKVFGVGFSKKYVVKSKNHETSRDDMLTVEFTQLRPHFDWDGRGWVRCMKKKPAKRGPILTSPKRPTCTALVPCSDTEQMRVTSRFYHNMKLNDVDIVSGAVSSLLSVHNGNESKHKPFSYLKKVVRPQHAVLALDSQMASPLMLSTTGFNHLRNDSSVSLRGYVEKSSSQMIAMPSGLQTGQAHSSLFGQFGQLRSIPQGPVLGMQSSNPYFGSVVGSKKAMTDQKKQSTNESSCMIAHHQNSSAEPVVETDLSRKRKECVDFQPTRENPEIRKKRMVDKSIEGANDNVVISEEATKQNTGDHEPPNDAIPVSGLHSQTSTVSCTDLDPIKDGSQESTGVDKMSKIDELCQVGYIRAPEHVATKVDDLTENLVQSITPASNNHNHEVNVLCSDSSNQSGMQAIKDGMCAIMEQEQNSCERFRESFSVVGDAARVSLLPSPISFGAAVQDLELSEDSIVDMVDCMTSFVVPADSLSNMSPVKLSGAILNMAPSSENCDTENNDNLDKVDHQESVIVLSNRRPQTQDASIVYPFLDTSSLLNADMLITEVSTNEFAVNEQHEASREVCTSAIVECAADKISNSQMPAVDMGNSNEAEFGTNKSTLSRLPLVDVSVSTTVEHHNSLIVPEEFGYSSPAGNRTYHSCSQLLQRSQVVHEAIMADRHSGSLGVKSFPFMKTSPMWVHIEAMEVFNKVPQQPKFHQFQQHPPELREGLALGLMFSFANIAESVKRLKIEDETAVFEEKMKGLSLLEAEGFDVRVLRSHVAALLHKKNSRNELQHAMKVLEEKISQKEVDDQQASMQISALNTALHQHEVYAGLIRSIMKSVIRKRLNNATDLSNLRMEASELGKSYASAEQNL